MGQIGAGILKMSAEHPEYMRRTLREVGHDLDDEQLAKLVEGIKHDEFRVEPTKMAWLSGMIVPAQVADLVSHMPWTVVDAPGDFEFLTSDAPVVKVLTDHQVPQMLAGGWLSPSAEATLALDPKTCLVIRPDGKEKRIDGKREWCRDANRRLVVQARRFVFSRSRAAYVEELAKQERGPTTP